MFQINTHSAIGCIAFCLTEIEPINIYLFQNFASYIGGYNLEAGAHTTLGNIKTHIITKSTVYCCLNTSLTPQN